MRIYTCYSDSHLPMVSEFLLPSVPEGFDLCLRHIAQSCPTGNYGDSGWSKAMADKERMILKAIETEQDTFIVCDADIAFYDLNPNEIAAAETTVSFALDCPLVDAEPPSYCAGFAVIKPCQLSHELYTIVLDNLAKIGREQPALTGVALPNMLARHPKDFHVAYLPSERYWNKTHPRTSQKLAVHHANWVIGIPAKLAELRRVRDLELTSGWP